MALPPLCCPKHRNDDVAAFPLVYCATRPEMTGSIALLDQRREEERGGFPPEWSSHFTPGAGRRSLAPLNLSALPLKEESAMTERMNVKQAPRRQLLPKERGWRGA